MLVPLVHSDDARLAVVAIQPSARFLLVTARRHMLSCPPGNRAIDAEAQAESSPSTKAKGRSRCFHAAQYDRSCSTCA
jgi:hypothetical protein